MRVLVVSTVTAILLLGAVPLAAPGVPRLHGVPPPVAVAVLVLAAAAFLGGLVLLVLGRHARRRAHGGFDGSAAEPAPAPQRPRPAAAEDRVVAAVVPHP